MRPAEFEDNQIIEAAEQLLKDGRRVTGFALRKEIGGGNPSRLVRVWEDYRRTQEVVESEPVQDLPVEVEEALAEMTGAFLDQIRTLAINLNNKAVKTAERRVADVMKSAKEQQESAEAELIDAATTVEDLEEQLADRDALLKQTSENLNAAATSLDQLRQKAAELEKDLAVTTEKLDQERSKRKAAEKEVGSYQEQNASLEADKKDLRDQRDSLKEGVKENRNEIEELKKANDNLVNVSGEMKTQLSALAEREQAALRRAEERKEERDASRKAEKEAERKAVQFETQAESLQKELDALRSSKQQIPTDEVSNKK